MEIFSIGTDIEDNDRFKNKTPDNDRNFLKKIYTDNELNYCFSTKQPQNHLCARFCAKEAVIKALSEFNIKDLYYSDIEILNLKSGAPCVKIKKYPNIDIKISISHCKKYSTAVAIALNNI